MKLPGEDLVVRGTEGALEGKTDEHTRCLNCEEALHGPYCSVCGQRATTLDVSLGEFVREALDNLLSVDSRLWRTLITLLRRPGELTVEYWQGRRERFLPPLRLYLVVSFVSFLVFGLTENRRMINAGADDGGIVRVQGDLAEAGLAEDVDWEEIKAGMPAFGQWLVDRVVRPAVEQPERATELFFRRLPWAVFLLVPFFAVLLRIFYRKQHRFLVPHLIFSLHLHTVGFFSLALGELGDRVFGTDTVSSLASLAILVALYLSLRRAYGQGRLKTLLKLTALAFVHAIALTLALLAAVALALMSL